jgi:hypothetical protein
MGFIHPTHGRISIETRGDYGFIIHAGYGYKPGTATIGDLKPGATFVSTDPRESNPEEGEKEKLSWKVRAVYEDRVEAAEEQFSTIAVFPLNRKVEVPGTEDFDESEPLARSWNGVEGAHPHPEFKREDLDDLIDALVEVRDKS